MTVFNYVAIAFVPKKTVEGPVQDVPGTQLANVPVLGWQNSPVAAALGFFDEFCVRVTLLKDEAAVNAWTTNPEKQTDFKTGLAAASPLYFAAQIKPLTLP